MTDHLTQKDRRALGLPREEDPRWVALLHAVALGICVGAVIVLLVVGIMILAATQ